MSNIPVIFRFLKDLTANNNREWFNEHREEYEIARLEFENFLSNSNCPYFHFLMKVFVVFNLKNALIAFTGIPAFLPIKLPIRIILGDILTQKGKNPITVGTIYIYNLRVAMLAGGSLCLPSNILKALRQSIYDNIDEYRSIVEDPEFQQFFPIVGEDFLKTAPKGFPKDFKYIDYLKPKEFTCAYSVPDSFFLTPDILDKIEEVFRQFKRFADFTNFTIDDFE